jgi:cytochrome c oxidase assembly protein subunit 11
MSTSEKPKGSELQPVVIDARSNQRVAGFVVAGVLTMLGAAYAAVPLYDLFCRVTGFGGTPMVASQAPATISDRVFTIRFDANVAPGLGWRFTPEVPTITLRAGEVKTVSYTVRNMRESATTGIASFNVTPAQTGGYFNKIACFCFTDLTLQPGEERAEEVVFFIDPAISKERELDSIVEITLSYTFFPAKSGAKPLADAGQLTSGAGTPAAGGSN